MYRSIVVGITNHTTALAATEHALELARATDAIVHLVYAIPAGDERSTDDTRRHAEGLVESLSLSRRNVIETHVVADPPDVAICAVANRVGADLIVIGNQGLDRRWRFGASTPARVIGAAPCCVLIVDTSSARVS